MSKPVLLRTALTCACAALLVAGCFASSPQVDYYSLYAPAQRPVAVVAAGAPPVISVGPVTIPDILKQAQIATGGADGRYRLAEYHRWSGELDRDFARALAEQLAGNLGTEQVALFPWDQNLGAQWRVLVDVLSLGGEPGTEATLSVRWTLIDTTEKRPLLARRSDLREAAAASYPAWVAAQQRNIAKLAEGIAAELTGRSLP